MFLVVSKTVTKIIKKCRVAGIAWVGMEVLQVWDGDDAEVGIVLLQVGNRDVEGVVWRCCMGGMEMLLDGDESVTEVGGDVA